MRLYISTNTGCSGSSHSRFDMISRELVRHSKQGHKISWIRYDDRSENGSNIMARPQTAIQILFTAIPLKTIDLNKVEAFQVMDADGKTYDYSGCSLNTHKYI